MSLYKEKMITMLDTCKMITYQKVVTWLKENGKGSDNPLSFIRAISDLKMECIEGCVFG